MEWIWRHLAHYVGRTKMQIEFKGISGEVLEAALRQEALNRLQWVELIIFSEEIDDRQKIEMLQQWFLAEE